MLFVVGLHCSLKVGESVVYFLVNGNVNFGRSGPENNHTVNAGLFLEVADILAELLNEFPAGAGLYVVAVEALRIVVVESSLEGLDSFELFLHGKDIFLLEHLSIDSRFECVFGINVPSGEYDVVKVGDGNNFVVFEVFFISTFTDTHAVVLSHGANRLGETLAGLQIVLLIVVNSKERFVYLFMFYSYFGR